MYIVCQILIIFLPQHLLVFKIELFYLKKYSSYNYRVIIYKTYFNWKRELWTGKYIF